MFMKRVILSSLVLVMLSLAVPSATFAGEGKDDEQLGALKNNEVLAALLIILQQQRKNSEPPPPPPPPPDKPNPPPPAPEAGPQGGDGPVGN